MQELLRKSFKTSTKNIELKNFIETLNYSTFNELKDQIVKLSNMIPESIRSFIKSENSAIKKENQLSLIKYIDFYTLNKNLIKSEVDTGNNSDITDLIQFFQCLKTSIKLIVI